jgi:hypothetical protein
MENINKQRKQLEEKLIAKAMKDETFRKNLLENPKLPSKMKQESSCLRPST